MLYALKGALPQLMLGTDFIPPLCSRAPDFRMDKRGTLFEALFAKFHTPPILKSGAQGSRRADQIAGAAFGLLGLLAAQKP